MRAPRSLATLASVVVLSVPVLSGCGGDDDGGTGSGSDGSPSTSEESAPSGGGDGGDAEPAEETSVSFADCSAITAEEMGAVLGEGTATAEVPPGGGSCTYALHDPRMPSVSLEQFGVDDVAGGWEEYRAQINNTAVGAMDATPEPVDGVGDGAQLVVGPSVSGGGSLMSIGVVLLGDTIVRATTLQAADLDEAALTQVTTDILTLVADSA